MRKTIYFGKKDPQLKKLVEECEDYLVSDMVKSLMKDGLRYRQLIEGNREVEVFKKPSTEKPAPTPAPIIEEKPTKETKEEIVEDDDFTVDLSDLDLETNENDDDSTDLYDKLSQC